MKPGRALALTLAVLVLGSCSDDGRQSTATAPTTEAPRRGGVLRLGIESPHTLDPVQAKSTSELLAADLLFDSLTSIDPSNGAVRPALSRSWTSSPDQRHWDFRLRAGARFANRRAITSDDVKYTLERVSRPGSGAAELVVSALAPVEAVNATTPDTVRIDLKEPLADLPAVLANPAFGVVPREAVEAPSPAFAQEPVGSGPFAFGSRDASSVHLRRAGAGPHLDGVDLVLGTAAESYTRFTSGKLDWSLVPSDKAKDAATRYGRDGFARYLAVLFYGFNLKSPKFADVRFREAVAHAVDRVGVVRHAYGESVSRLDGPVPRGVPEFQPTPCGAKCTHDVAKAKELIGQAFPGAAPPELQIDFEDDTTQRSVAKAIQDDLVAAGIPAALRPHPVGDYAQVVGRGEQELFRFGWVGVYPGAGNFLVPLFSTGSETNVTGFSLPAVDDLLRTARSEPNAGRRRDLYRDAERRIMDLVPIVPLAQFETLTVMKPRVQGLQLNVLGTFDASTVWLDSSG